MGRFVGNTPNHMSVGGKGGGSGTIVQTSTFDRVSGLSTYSNNNVGIVTLGDNTYTEIQYNNVGLITGYNEIIGTDEKGWILTYDSVGIVSTIVQRESLHPVGAGASAQGDGGESGGGEGGGGGGGSGLPSSTPVYTTAGQSYYISNNTSTWNGVKVWYAQSSSTGFSNSTNTDDWGTYVVDGNYSNTQWYIGMNWGGTALPGRWVMRMQLMHTPATPMVLLTFGNSNTGGPHTTRFYSVRGSSTQVSGTSAGIVTCNYNDFETDATSWTNSSGFRFAAWYADSNRSDQKYPDIITAIKNHSPQYNPEGQSNGDDEGGMILWKPPAPTKEVMITYANNHSNSTCNITCWDNNTGQVKWQARYGNFASVDTGGGTLNPNGGRVIVAEHQDGYVYFNSDHAGTVSGSWYYLYR